jgi:rhamnulokinase
VTSAAGLRLAAVDLGAESGRVVLGTFDGAQLRTEEAHRFPNVPVHLGGTLYWDFLRIFGDVVTGIGRAGDLASVGVDAWGVDFGLLDASGRLLGNPVHYRDRRTEGAIERVTRRVRREEIYAATGIQFMEINTLYQLFSMLETTDSDLDRADRLLLIPDLVNHFLCGSTVGEYTNATTTQCYDVERGEWADGLLARLGIPRALFPNIIQPGTLLGPLLPEIADQLGQAGSSVQVVAPGTHDTASAVAGIPLSADGHTAFLSSGTWSLLGLEVDRPVKTDAALAANLTNEGGVGGTIRLLKNVMGLWLVQAARRALGRRGEPPSYDELIALAEQARPFTAFIDPDDGRFLRLADGELIAAVEAFCQETNQPAPPDPGTLVRVLLESLALKYAWVSGQLAEVSGRCIRALYVVGGGAQNTLLCRLTASAAGLPVLAGSSEATAIGNLIVQAMALGELATLAEARELVARSFAAQCYEPTGDWSAARARFAELLTLDP